MKIIRAKAVIEATGLSRTTLWRLSRSAYRRLADGEPAAACRLLESILREYASAVREEGRAQELGD